MKKIKIIIVLTLVLIVVKSSYADSLYVYPSFYYTFGKYSSGESSVSYSGFLTAAFNSKSFLTFGYDNLDLDYKSGNYLQKNYIIGFLHSIYPSYIKAAYGNISGSSQPLSSSNLAEEKINIFSLEYYFFQNMFYYGLGGTYLTQSNGFSDLNSLQLKLRTEYIVSPFLFISIKPTFTYLSDNRKLFSASFYVSWNLFLTYYIKLGGMVGKRALYFDNDLLTIFNQNETQSGLYSGQIDYLFMRNNKITAGFLHTKFPSYSIDYYYVGLRTGIKF